MADVGATSTSTSTTSGATSVIAVAIAARKHGSPWRRTRTAAELLETNSNFTLPIWNSRRCSASRTREGTSTGCSPCHVRTLRINGSAASRSVHSFPRIAMTRSRMSYWRSIMASMSSSAACRAARSCTACTRSSNFVIAGIPILPPKWTRPWIASHCTATAPSP